MYSDDTSMMERRRRSAPPRARSSELVSPGSDPVPLRAGPSRFAVPDVLQHLILER